MSANMAVIKGRIYKVDQANGKFYHEVQLPAVDEFSHPGWVKLVADKMLGAAGHDIACKATMSGFRRTFKRRDGLEGSEIQTMFTYAGDVAQAVKGAA